MDSCGRLPPVGYANDRDTRSQGLQLPPIPSRQAFATQPNPTRDEFLKIGSAIKDWRISDDASDRHKIEEYIALSKRSDNERPKIDISNCDSLSEHLSRHKCRLKGERNFVWVRPNFSLQPNLQILALSQFQLSSLEEATPTPLLKLCQSKNKLCWWR